MMTYEQAIQFWSGRVNYEQHVPQPGDLGLDRMRGLLDRLGNPQDRLRIVHVAGSKGKGSTAALLAAVLRRAGYRTGLFTSPHLVAVEERIQVDGEPISHDELAARMDAIRRACERPPSLERAVTFFEIGTALGFLHFVCRRVDVAVVEVGLGGRFDSTNVCRPLLSILTSISLDHTQLLGNTVAEIAFEKAGIVKPGRPTVSGARADEARRVIEAVCRQRGSRLRQLDDDFHYTHEPARVDAAGDQLPTVAVRTWRRAWPGMTLGLIGEHQAANAAVAVAAVEVLREQGLPIGDRAVVEGLRDVCWPARLEILGRRPLVLLDCAHNVASARALVEALTTSFPLGQRGRRLLVFAGSRDKDLAGILGVLVPHFDRIFLTRFQNSTRAVAPEQALALLPDARRGVVCPTVADAWRQARQAATEDDLICAAGSVFLAGELRPLIQGESR